MCIHLNQSAKGQLYLILKRYEQIAFLFSLDRIFVKAGQCRHSSPLGTFCVLRGEDRGFTAHSLIFRSRSSMPIIDVLLFLLEDFHSGEFVKSCIFVPVFKE